MEKHSDPLVITSNHQRPVGHMIRIVDITHLPVILFHNVMFRVVITFVTKIFFCWWWVYISQHVNLLSFVPN